VTKRKREPMPSLERVRGSYYRQMELLVGIKLELDEAMRDFTLGHDAGLSALRSGTGKLGTRSSGSDTTAQADYEFHRLQGACAFAAGLVLDSERDLKRATQRLERAGSAILNAWLDTDPEIGQERRERRRAVLADAPEQGSLTMNPTPVILQTSRTHDGA